MTGDQILQIPGPLAKMQISAEELSALLEFLFKLLQEAIKIAFCFGSVAKGPYIVTLTSFEIPKVLLAKDTIASGMCVRAGLILLTGFRHRVLVLFSLI